MNHLCYPSNRAPRGSGDVLSRQIVRVKGRLLRNPTLSANNRHLILDTKMDEQGVCLGPQETDCALGFCRFLPEEGEILPILINLDASIIHKNRQPIPSNYNAMKRLFNTVKRRDKKITVVGEYIPQQGNSIWYGYIDQGGVYRKAAYAYILHYTHAIREGLTETSCGSVEFELDNDLYQIY